jgi:hypothetical protein
MIRTNTWLALLLLLTIPSITNAQSKKRIEIELQENTDHHIIPLEKNGVLVMYKAEGKGKGSDLVFELYDTDLKKENSTSSTLADQDAILIDYVANSEDVFMVYADAKSTAIHTFMKEFEIVNYNVKTRTVRKFSAKFEDHIYYKKMFVKNGIVSVVGSMGLNPYQIIRRSCFSSLGCIFLMPMIAQKKYSKLKPTVHTFDFNKKTISAKSATYLREKERSEMMSASMNDSTGDISLIAKTIISKKENKHTIHNFKEGKFEKEINIKFPSGKEIVDARVTTFDNRIVYGGTYSTKVSKTNQVAVSAGVAVGLIENGKSVFNTTIPYNKFKNFKFAMSNLEKKMAKKSKKKGLAESSMEMMMKYHPTVEQDGKYLFLAEVFFPTYRIEVYTEMVNGRPQTRTRRVFDGFQYQGGVVFAVSDKGEFLWENGVNVKDNNRYFSSNSYRYKFIEQGDGGIKLLYNDGKTLYTSTIYDGSTIIEGSKIPLSEEKEGNKKTKVQAKNTTDLATTVSKNGVEYWYDNYFLSFGEQKITSKKEGKALGKNRKTVYYLEKVDVD